MAGGPVTAGHTGLDADLHVPGRVRAALRAEPGEVVALVGPNGAGKSSLLQALAGVVPASGRLRLDGRDLAGLPARERRVGVVFQQGLLLPHLSALDNVAYGPRARGVERAAARSTAAGWLERLGIADLAGRRPRELSGGQAQRVAIARALACEPDLLLLDEPMGGLDVHVATALRIELAHHLAAYDGVAVLVAHDALDVLTLADRVVALEDGVVVQSGPARDVAAHPTSVHVARLVGLNVVPDGTELLTFAPEAVGVWSREPAGSPRHRWTGTVAALAPWGGALRLLVRTGVGDLIADVTPSAATELGLVPGVPVWLSVKETAVRRTPAP